MSLVDSFKLFSKRCNTFTATSYVHPIDPHASLSKALMTLAIRRCSAFPADVRTIPTKKNQNFAFVWGKSQWHSNTTELLTNLAKHPHTIAMRPYHERGHDTNGPTEGVVEDPWRSAHCCMQRPTRVESWQPSQKCAWKQKRFKNTWNILNRP